MNKQFVLSAVVAMAAFAATAEVMDRPQGIKIGQRMTLRPYVSIPCACVRDTLWPMEDPEMPLVPIRLYLT